MDPSKFPMAGFACLKCDHFSTLEENSLDHQDRTKHGYEAVILAVTQKRVRMSKPPSTSCRSFMRLVFEKYKDKPDDFALSIGHWEPMPSILGVRIPEFVAYMKLTVGELKAMFPVNDPRGEIFACPKCKNTSGDDWTQCRGSCPMPMSPHFNPEERSTWNPGIKPEAAAATKESKSPDRTGSRTT